MKTYNRRDSQMVTHSSTSRPVQCLCMAERTGCPVLTDLWSYVLIVRKCLYKLLNPKGSRQHRWSSLQDSESIRCLLDEASDDMRYPPRREFGREFGQLQHSLTRASMNCNALPLPPRLAHNVKQTFSHQTMDCSASDVAIRRRREDMKHFAPRDKTYPVIGRYGLW